MTKKPGFSWVGKEDDPSGIAVLKLGSDEYRIALQSLADAIVLHDWIQCVYEAGAEDARGALLHRMYAVLTEGEK